MRVRNLLICFVGLVRARSSARRLSNDHCIEFDGRRLQVAPTWKEFDTILGHFPLWPP